MWSYRPQDAKDQLYAEDHGPKTVDDGGEVTSDASLILNSTGDSDDVAAHPYTAQNSGIFVKDANNLEVFRLWASDPDLDIFNFNTANLYIGSQAGLAQPSDNTSAGFSNTGIGYQALKAITTGDTNVAVGTQALLVNESGRANIAIGAFTLGANTWGSENVGVGTSSLYAHTTGYNNVAIGTESLLGLIDGHENVAIGKRAGDGAVHDNAMVFIGLNAARSGPGTLQNAIAIGFNAFVDTSFTAVLGNNEITDVYFGSTAGLAKIHGKGDAIVFPDSDPHVAGAAYWLAGVLTKSTG